MSELEMQHYPIDVTTIPKTWSLSSISDLNAEVKSGFPTGDHNKDGHGIPHIRPMNIDRNGAIDLSDVKYVSPETNGLRLQLGDVLFNNTNSPELIGKTTAITQCENWAFSNHMTRLRFGDGVDYRYAAQQLHFLWMTKYFRHRCVNHVNQASISGKPLSEFVPFLLAPLNEQRRIVAKIEELFSNLDAGVAALKRAKANLKRYRAAVLKAAVEGTLTAEWRAAHPDAEPAATLLARILSERRQKWQADQLAKFAAAKKEPPKGWQAKYVEPKGPETSGLPELPAGWCWTSVEQLGCVQLGRQRSPKNRSDKFPTKYIRAANLTEGGLALDDILDMEFQPRELETYRLHPGDILLSEASGSPDQVGKPVVWNGEIENCCFQNTVIRLRPEGMPSDYPLTVFRHYYMNKIFAKLAGGVGINHLSAAKFSSLAFPLAPLAEQKQIADEVELRLSTIAVSVRLLEVNLLRAARLRQSILKQAFEGKLVPQDPTDEPARVLLARIQSSPVAKGRARSVEKSPS